MVSFMKWTKDTMSSPPSDATIDSLVAVALDLGVTHCEIATVLGGDNWASESLRWASRIHAAGLKVTWRCASDKMEGLYSTPYAVGVNRETTSYWYTLVDDSIRNNPDLWADGDEFGFFPERTENNSKQRTISSITRSGSTATVTTSTNHDWSDNYGATTKPVLIAGASQSEYNGGFLATKTGDNTFTYTVTGTPATPATGTMNVRHGYSIYTDELSPLSHSGGITTNYGTFFSTIKSTADAAFAFLGVSVDTGLEANNYTEVASGWLPTVTWTKCGIICIDHYQDGDADQLDTDLRATYASKGYPIYLQEGAVHRFSTPNSTQITEFFDVLTGLVNDGILQKFGYWGGWSGTPESLIDGSFNLTESGTAYKNFLAQYSDPKTVTGLNTVTGLQSITI